MIPVIVYTTHFGNIKDTLKDPAIVNPKCKYICWTDKPLKSKIWEIEHNQPEEDPEYWCRFYKIQSSVFFPAPKQITLWMDCSYRLLVDPVKIVNDCFLKNYDLMTYKSPHRNNLLDEAREILENPRVSKQNATVLRDLLDIYGKEGFPTQEFSSVNPHLTCPNFMIRRNTVALQDFEHRWWNEYKRWYPGCTRDMMTIDYSLWRSEINVQYFEGHYRDNPYARFFKDK